MAIAVEGSNPLGPSGNLPRRKRVDLVMRSSATAAAMLAVVVLIIAIFYFAYTLVRDIRGDQPVSVFQATTNAHRIINLERHLGIFHEATVHDRYQW